MPMPELQEIRRWSESVASPVVTVEAHHGKRFARVQCVVLGEEPIAQLVNESNGLIADVVIAGLVFALALWNHSKDPANSWSLIMCPRRRGAGLLDQPITAELHLHCIVYAHSRRGEEIQCHEP